MIDALFDDLDKAMIDDCNMEIFVQFQGTPDRRILGIWAIPAVFGDVPKREKRYNCPFEHQIKQFVLVSVGEGDRPVIPLQTHGAPRDGSEAATLALELGENVPHFVAMSSENTRQGFHPAVHFAKLWICKNLFRLSLE